MYFGECSSDVFLQNSKYYTIEVKYENDKEGGGSN